jgi:uncharacterized membrane protein
MTIKWKTYVAVLVVLLVLDAIWLNVAKNMYNGLVKGVQEKDIQVKYIPAILCYIVLYMGLLMFAIPLAREYSKKNGKILAALLYGGAFGLAVYGVFNLTNLAIFADYKWSVGIVDTMWGVFVCSIATYAGLYFQ